MWCEHIRQKSHNALSVWDKQVLPLPPPESQRKGESNNSPFLVIRASTFPLNPPLSKGDLSLRSNILCTVGIFSLDPAKFSRSRTLQCHKIRRNSMQFFSRSKSNPKRREHGVTNFSLSQKMLRILRRSYLRFSYELILGTFLWLIAIAFWGA